MLHVHYSRLDSCALDTRVSTIARDSGAVRALRDLRRARSECRMFDSGRLPSERPSCASHYVFHPCALGSQISTVARVLGVIDGFRDPRRALARHATSDLGGHLFERFCHLPLGTVPAAMPRYPNKTLHLTAGRPEAPIGR